VRDRRSPSKGPHTAQALPGVRARRVAAWSWPWWVIIFCALLSGLPQSLPTRFLGGASANAAPV
jgi:hypothetical protein